VAGTSRWPINYGERIPDDVDLDENRALQRALERWQAKFLE
jgi:benzoyl-CoA 2,3-epoxidase subunit B